jgi:glutamate-ammonia-ligase adenylyltransferase
MTPSLSLAGPRHIAEPAGDGRAAILRAGDLAPYLARLAAGNPATVEQFGVLPFEAIIEAGIGRVGSLEAPDKVSVSRGLREAKQVVHLAVAAADLSSAWTLDSVVRALSRLADASVEAALRSAISTAWASGWFGEKSDRADMPGLFVLAMGKMGAWELNYSSDIDLIVLFDPDIAPVDPARVKEGMTRLTRELVRLLEERTPEGYAFRTDLRLRPDPGSTAPAISTRFAHSYYESVGQNWERMAHIKARVCAGDREAGSRYLSELEPYVWRRHLDYWAIADIHSIKRQIHAHGEHAALADRDFDVKLGRGGIREIEFFVQVQQLILGGRIPELRAAGTKAALKALELSGIVDTATVDDLTTSYDFLRTVEHRLQMLNDEQTHHLTDRAGHRSIVAALCGYDSQDVFENDVVRVRRRVHGVYSDLFAQEERLSGAGGNLVFTGVDEDPGTVATLGEMGFANPSLIIRTLQAWHRGSIRATRTARGRQLLTSLGPQLLTAISETGEPDAAFRRFSDFFEGLASGVQTMSLMLAEPELTGELVASMAFAPKLASDLARRPGLMEAVLEPVGAQDDCVECGYEALLRRRVEATGDFEEKLNEARRFHRDEAFRIGYSLLQRHRPASAAAEAYTKLADACVRVLADAAEAEVLGRFDGAIGRWAVCAMGKFGGHELTASSDLDLMLIYDPEGAGEPNLAARFVQRLIAALSAPTPEGLLYEVDMQLRPSGRAGPVAVKLTAFEAYYAGDAWTWEFMALTRLRPVAGNTGLMAHVSRSTAEALRRKSNDPALREDVLDMRRRLFRERPPKSAWDLKMAPGGLVDIEFVLQYEMLKAAGEYPAVVQAASAAALEALAEAGRLAPTDAASLRAALTFILELQQALRVAVSGDFDPASASDGMKAWLAGLMGLASFGELEKRLFEHCHFVASIREMKLGPAGDGEARVSR